MIKTRHRHITLIRVLTLLALAAFWFAFLFIRSKPSMGTVGYYEDTSASAKTACLKDEIRLAVLTNLCSSGHTDAFAFLASDKILNALISKRNSDQKKLDDLMARTGESDSHVKTIADRVSDADSNIAERIKGIKLGMEAHAASLRAISENSRARAQELRSAELQKTTNTSADP